jgi:hypothetical protein
MAKNNDVVVAYFSNSADAQRAIDDLLAEGFEARQMGAAFRGGRAATAAAFDEEESGSKPVRSAVGSDTLGSGPTSGSSAVTPAGLSTGSGSVTSGIGRKGPIPGSEIPHHRSSGVVQSSSTVANPLPATGGFHEDAKDENSWWEKLKHVFGADTDRERREGIVDGTSMNFGTGEGHLATYPDSHEYVYSGAAFEGAFSGMGISQTHAGSLVGDLRNGGAILSVNTGGRLAEAERVLERNHGRLRYEATSSAARREEIPGERVHVFGELSRTYPGYLSGSDASRRKAS